MTENAYSPEATAPPEEAGEPSSRAAAPAVAPLRTLRSLLSRAGRLPFAFAVHTDGGSGVIGEGEPVFDLYVRNARGLRALRSLHELVIADAYMRGDLDI